MPEVVLPLQTSAGLGYSSVGAAEWHCAGLIESLQIDYQVKFEETLKARLLKVAILPPNSTHSHKS